MYALSMISNNKSFARRNTYEPPLISVSTGRGSDGEKMAELPNGTQPFIHFIT